MHADLRIPTVAVVGGTSGIGLAVARAINEAGGTVAVLGRDDEHLGSAQRALKGIVRSGDACKVEDVESLLADAWREFGSIGGLVHVAGGSGRAFGDGPLHELSDAGLQRTMELNFHPVVWSNRAAVRKWMEHETGGSIVNIGSVLASCPAPRHFATIAYASAKAAIDGFTRSLAAAYAPQNIRANVIAPGLTETPMSLRAAADPDIMDFVRKRQPLDGGRAGRPEDITGAVLFLLSEAARFCTGQVIAVDGGWSVSGA